MDKGRLDKVLRRDMVQEDKVRQGKGLVPDDKGLQDKDMILLDKDNHRIRNLLHTHSHIHSLLLGYPEVFPKIIEELLLPFQYVWNKNLKSNLGERIN